MYAVLFHASVEADISKALARDIERIKGAIETKLRQRPELYGSRLRGSLEAYWKLRVGDYRIVYMIERDAIRILAIANRKDIYKIALKRGS